MVTIGSCDLVRLNFIINFTSYKHADLPNKAQVIKFFRKELM